MNHADNDRLISYAGYRLPPEIISYAVWLYFCFPLSLRMVEEMLAARFIDVTMKRYASVLSWKFIELFSPGVICRALCCTTRWL